MTITIMIAVIGFVTAIVTGLVSWAVAKRRNSGNIATSDAASLWTESTQMRKDLRSEVESLRTELREAGIKLDAAIARATDLLQEVTLSNAATAAAREETAAAREETRIARAETQALREEIQSIHEEVRTGNALTMGAMADNQESRRILAIPVAERTADEHEHLETLGIQARSMGRGKE